MTIASVHVNYRPLSGSWDGYNWEQQLHRCSNNFQSGSTPPVAPGGATSILWQIVGASDPGSIVFDVKVDLPGDDELLFTGVRNGIVTNYLPTPSITDHGQDGITPFHKNHPWLEYYSRGIYIADVFGASAPFTINVDASPTVSATIASVHVNYRPLSGSWDGYNWEQQLHRCSNNFLSGSTPPVAPGGATSIVWQVVGPSDPGSIVFNVKVDLPGDDEVLFTGVRDGMVTNYLPIPTPTDVGEDGTPFHKGHRWDEYYSRGIYIADVFGASAPFSVNVHTTHGPGHVPTM